MEQLVAEVAVLPGQQRKGSAPRGVADRRFDAVLPQVIAELREKRLVALAELPEEQVRVVAELDASAAEAVVGVRDERVPGRTEPPLLEDAPTELGRDDVELGGGQGDACPISIDGGSPASAGSPSSSPVLGAPNGWARMLPSISDQRCSCG